jgi:hypothetical protein
MLVKELYQEYGSDSSPHPRRGQLQVQSFKVQLEWFENYEKAPDAVHRISVACRSFECAVARRNVFINSHRDSVSLRRADHDYLFCCCRWEHDRGLQL